MNYLVENGVVEEGHIAEGRRGGGRRGEKVILLLVEAADVADAAALLDAVQVVDVDGAVAFQRPVQTHWTQRQ